MDKFKKADSAKLFWIVILGIVLYVILDVIAQILPPHYSPISQAESDLAVGKFGLIMTVNFLNRGVLSLLFVFAFLQTLDVKSVARLPFRTGAYLLGIWRAGLSLYWCKVVVSLIFWFGGRFEENKTSSSLCTNRPSQTCKHA